MRKESKPGREGRNGEKVRKGREQER